MRPIFYDYPQAIGASCDQSMDFTLGAALLIAPPPKMESPEAYDVCLPKGGWYDYWTGKPVAAGQAGEPGSPANEQSAAAQSDEAIRLTEHPALDRLPVFVRAGAILPRQPLVQSTAETPQGPLSLDIYPGPDCAGTLYLDDGHSMAFEKGKYLRQTIRCTRDASGRLTITFGRREGDYPAWWTRIAVTIHDWRGPSRVSGAAGAIASQQDPTAETIAFTLPDKLANGAIVVEPGA
jgi:alpha-glucosidase